MMTIDLKKSVFTLVIIFQLLNVTFGTTLKHQKYDDSNFCQNAINSNYSAKNPTDPVDDVSMRLEKLNLSYNNLTTINKQCFSIFNKLKHVNLSYNSIISITVDAFGKLAYLNSVDLSYNCLESLNENLFQSNLLLHTVKLEGNKFTTLPDAPFINSKSLVSLNLRNTQLTKVTKETFSKVPLLEELNISDNFLTILNVDAFTYTQQLKFLALNNNAWICDESFRDAVSKVRQLGVDVQLTSCNVVDFSDKFHTENNTENKRELTVVDVCVQLREIPRCNVTIPEAYCAYFTAVIQQKPLRNWYTSSNNSYSHSQMDMINSFFTGILFGIMSFIILLIFAYHMFNKFYMNCYGPVPPMVTHSDPPPPYRRPINNNNRNRMTIPLDLLL